MAIINNKMKVGHMGKIYFIVNPNAKNGSCLKTWRKLEVDLRATGVSFLAFFTEYPGHAQEIAETLSRKASGQPLIIAAVGGDGTMHEVVNGAAAYPNTMVGFIPGGSGNDFSRGYRIPKKASDALQLFIGENIGASIDIDIGKIGHNEVHETYFMNNMGVGFDAIISKEANESRMKKLLNRLSLGRLVYVFILVKNVFTYRLVPYDLTVDGKEMSFKSAWFITVSNQRFYGGGMKIAPHAHPSDGLLDVTVVSDLSRWKLLLVFISVFWGKHTMFKEVLQFTAKTITIDSPRKVLVHADGEIVGHTPLRIDVCPKKLRILAGYDTAEQMEELRSDDGH